MATPQYDKDDDVVLEISTTSWADYNSDAEEAVEINAIPRPAVEQQIDTIDIDDSELDPNTITDDEVEIAESALEGMDTYEIGFGDYTFDTGIEADPNTMAFVVGAGESMMSSFRGLSQIAEEYTPIDHLFGFGKEDMQRNERYVRALNESEEYGTALTAGQLTGYIAEPIGFLIPGGKAAGIVKMMGRGAITAGALGYVDYVDAETDESRLFNTGLGIALGGALGYGIGKWASKSLPQPIAGKNVSKQMEDMDTFEDLLAREMNTVSNPEQAMRNVQEKYPDAYAKGVDAKRVMSSTFDVEGAKANLPINEEIARTGYPADTIDMDYLGKHRKHNGIEKLILTIDERVRNLSPRMYKKLMDYETYLKVQPQKLKSLRDGFGSYFESHSGRTQTEVPDGGTFSEDEVNKLKYFTVNGMFDEAEVFIREAKDEVAVRAFRKATEVFQKKGQELKDAGIIHKLEDNYWARVILPDQRDDFLEALEQYFIKEGREAKGTIGEDLADSLSKYKKHIEKVKTKLADKKKTLSEFDESEMFARWFLKDSSHITKNMAIKGRKLPTVPEELAHFYADPIQSMDSWIHRMVKEEANMKFIGEDAYMEGMAAVKGAGTFDSNAAVNSFGKSESTTELLKEMDGDARTELLGLIKLRMGDGMATPTKALRYYKGVVNSVLLGNPYSAFIQLGDIPRSAYNYGVKSAAKGFLQALKKESGSKLTIEELGLTKMAQEFEDIGDDKLLNKVVDGLFKYSGFAKADKLGKETLLNSALDHFADAVKDPSSKAFKKFRRKYEPIWGKDEFDALTSDLHKYAVGGRVKENVSDNIQSLLITELSQAQPINVSSQIEAGARSNWGKAYMTLKSFTLRQVNTVYRDIYKEASKYARNRDKEAAATATVNLVKFIATVGGGNLAVSEVRDILAGKTSFNDLANSDSGDAMIYALTAPSLYGLKMFNIDGYAFDKIARSGSIGGTLDIFAPPVPIVDDALRLLAKQNVTAGDVGEAVVKNTPYVGTLIKAIERHKDNFSGGSGVANFAEGGLVQSFHKGGGVHKHPQGGEGRATQINHAFITELEDAARTLVGIIPKDKDGKILGKSGVTIGGGFDLGQWRVEDLEGLPVELIEKYTPYMGLKGAKAAKKLKEMPLKIDGAEGGEYDIVTEFAHKISTDKLVVHWRDAAALNDKMPIKEFADLEPHQQTLVASIAYQFGENGSPTFTQAALEGRWEDAVSEVKEFDGKGKESKYQTRRNREIEEYRKVEGAIGGTAQEVSSVAVDMERDPKNPGTAKPTAVKDKSNQMPQFMDRIMNPSKYPQILNDDGSVSTHLMAAEMDEDGVSYAFPMIVSMSDGRLKQFKDPQEALTYNKSIGNVFEAASIEDAVKFTETYKKLNPELEKGILAGGPLQTEEYKEKTRSFAKGGEVKKEEGPKKLEAGVYQDEIGNLFKVTAKGEIEKVEG